ncbi:MAG: CopG family transcriptional regulator [Oscillospiraceae bacterium]|nr:CopG family transcriptional regulator [Oscillospiraceae bacterium]
MGNKKMGRPTDNPKTVSVKFLADDETFGKLKECSEELEISRAEVIRKGIHKVHDGLTKK